MSTIPTLHPADALRWQWIDSEVPSIHIDISDRIRRLIISAADVHNFVYHCVITMLVNRRKMPRDWSLDFPVPDHLHTILGKKIYLYIDEHSIRVYE